MKMRARIFALFTVKLTCFLFSPLRFGLVEEKPNCYLSRWLFARSILLNEGRNSEAAKYLRLAMAYDPAAERLLKECEDSMEGQPGQQNIEPPDQKRP
jgi:hypothetical protein